jgi:glycerol uptake facilitator-like aquaporin
VERTGSTLWISEVIATAGLVGIIVGLVVTNKSSFIPAGVGAWVFAAILFTPSTSFANPAVTFGRVFTSSGSGISPSSTVGFFIAQLIGAGIGAVIATAICKEDK